MALPLVTPELLNDGLDGYGDRAPRYPLQCVAHQKRLRLTSCVEKKFKIRFVDLIDLSSDVPDIRISEHPIKSAFRTRPVKHLDFIWG
jgi:hypothetical protein